jgi:polysaccharide export outer membrane protein
MHDDRDSILNRFILRLHDRTMNRLEAIILAVMLTTVVMATGCQTTAPERPPAEPAMVGPPVPHELNKTVLPAYTIEPPDVLLIDAVRTVPRAPYRLKSGDVLALQVYGLPSDQPISGVHVIDPGGLIRLGLRYGSIYVEHMTIDEASDAIRLHLAKVSKGSPIVYASIAEIAGKQQIAGQHLVAPDGTVTLGIYGNVRVVGMTLPQAKYAIEQHLAQYLDEPEISVEVYAYNSKVYYVVTQGAGMGDAVYRFPVTGNETVLDAIAQINGLTQLSSKKIWISRPTDVPGQTQILAVNWDGITSQAAANTNFQILPGDRVFVAEDKMVALDTGLGKFLAPMERVMGFGLLGVGTVTRFSGPVLQGGGNPRSTF